MKIYTLYENELASYFSDLSNYRIVVLIESENEKSIPECNKYSYLVINENTKPEQLLRELFYIVDTKIPIITVNYKERITLIDKFVEMFIDSCDIERISKLMGYDLIMNKIKNSQNSQKRIISIATVIPINDKLLIGDGENQPFYIREDLKHFKRVTHRSPCIVGFNTFKLFPNGLKDRFMFVITKSYYHLRNEYEKKGDIKFFDSINSALNYWLTKFHEEHLNYSSDKLIVIGGESIYKQMYKCIKTHYLTFINYKGDKLDLSKLNKEYALTINSIDNYEIETIQESMPIHEYMLNGQLCNDNNLSISILKYTLRY